MELDGEAEEVEDELLLASDGGAVVVVVVDTDGLDMVDDEQAN